MADAIALSASDKTATACGVGVAPLGTSECPTPILYTVRLARKSEIADHELLSLRNIVDTTASAVDKVPWAVLDKKSKIYSDDHRLHLLSSLSRCRRSSDVHCTGLAAKDCEPFRS